MTGTWRLWICQAMNGVLQCGGEQLHPEDALTANSRASGDRPRLERPEGRRGPDPLRQKAMAKWAATWRVGVRLNVR